jgi:hypothetical protein
MRVPVSWYFYCRLLYHFLIMEEGRSAFKMLTGRLNLKERPNRSREDNIIIDRKEIGANARNCVYLSQNRGYWRVLVNAPLNLRIP